MNIRHLLLFIFFIILADAGAQDPAGIIPGTQPDRIQLPWNRFIQPAGIQVFFGDESLENHALDAALSPDGKWLAVEERYSIIFISTADNKVKFRLANNSHPDLKGGMNTYSGIRWRQGENNPEVYWSTMGSIRRSFVASAKWDGNRAEFGRFFEFKTIPPATVALPNEILISKESEGEFLYVTLNGNNKVVKQNLSTGETAWSTDPGVAPYGLTMASGKLYVTNWAGRHPRKDDLNVAGVPWGLARVDSINGSTREGSVTILDPSDGRILKELVVGLHPNEIVADSKGKYIYITNSNSDNIAVINTLTDEIAESISVRLQPDINPFFGDSPDGLCLSPEEKFLYVANGMDNALAVIELGKKASAAGKRNNSRIIGFIPTGAYPSSVSISGSGLIYVTNLEASGARLGLKAENSDQIAFNTHHMLASVSVLKVPKKKELQAFTDTVAAVNNLNRVAGALEKPRSDAKHRPVPERIGEPSLFRHVVYIIKENRTYDQVLGDVHEGNGNPGLCIFGKEITPNTHKLSAEFMLLDNLHVSGKCSAEGHQWTDASIVVDYIEKNVRAWFRSYPHVQQDALVYAPTGFLWDNAMSHGKKVRIYGEASVPVFPKRTTWTELYHKYLKGEKIEFSNQTTIEPVRKILSQTYPSFGNHEFSDVMRADVLIRDLHEYEAQPGDQLPELMIVALPNDHTAGTRPGYPTPRAMVADNDVALGRIIEAFSKSRFWSNTVIFVIEDDSQSGWDHVSAYRTVGLVISPYSRLKKAVHTYYTQPCVVRTIEQILGLPPMNIQDAIANPMSDCFTVLPDMTPYEALPNNIPIDEMNPEMTSLTGRTLHYARESSRPEFDGIDSGNDDLLNRILWFSARGNVPYPSKYAKGGSDDDDDENEVK
jgi:YVTN family beta-propeller protein